MTTDKILVGKIVGAHGIRGEVRIKPLTSDPASVCSYRPITDSSGHILTLSMKGIGKNGAIIASIDAVSDRTAAERLKGTELYAPRDAIADEGEVLLGELAGLEVVDAAGRRLGVVKGILNFGAGDIIEVKMDGRDKTALILYTEDGVRAVDRKKGYVEIDAEYLLED
jgi:16S rRNA processing protein RimM